MHRPILRRALAASLCALPITFAGAAGAASPEFHQAVADSSPILHYRFDEATGDAVNYGSLGASFDASYLGTPVRDVPSFFGDSGVGFDSADDYLESLAVAPAQLTGNPSFSVEAVVFIPATGTVSFWPPILYWGPLTATPTGRSVFFGFSFNLADQAFLGFYNGGLQSPFQSMPAGRWHHLIWVRTGGGTASEGSTFYVDGVDITGTLVGDPRLCCNDLVPDVGSTEFRINRARDFEGTRHFDGILDELSLYDRALTPTEAADHYAALKWLFADGFETGTTNAWILGSP